MDRTQNYINLPTPKFGAIKLVFLDDQTYKVGGEQRQKGPQNCTNFRSTTT